jgi:hypothetical protein
MKISYRQAISKDGTVATQRLTINPFLLKTIFDGITKEVVSGFPNKEKYVQTSGGEHFLAAMIDTLQDELFINHTQTRFIKWLLNEHPDNKRLIKTNFNTYLVVR